VKRQNSGVAGVQELQNANLEDPALEWNTEVRMETEGEIFAAW
jgi:hypothetical protein